MAALVLALNPSIDAEWRVDDVLWEEKNNVDSERRWAGGKGINVARWLKQLGGKSQLLLPLGGQTGAELSKYLRAEQLPTKIIRLCEPTRVNVIITTKGGRQLRFNPLGPKLSPREWRGILNGVKQELARLPVKQGEARHPAHAGWRMSNPGPSVVPRPTSLLILSGSVPRGVPVTAYAQLIRLAHRRGAGTLLDCDGPVFTAAIKARPFLVKPNEHELAEWWGQPLRTEADILQAARALSAVTHGWVLVSCGGRRSLLVNTSEGFQSFARPRRVRPRNTVGAGDALLAGVAREIQLGHAPAEWLRRGVEVGTRATQMLAGQTP
jgi:fructose-1-phosphate kinase PfkB-like protein